MINPTRVRLGRFCQRLSGFAGRVERFCAALYEVTGNRRLAERLRKRVADR